MVDVYIGWAGLILLIVAWTPGAVNTWRNGKTEENPAFLMTYALSSLLLLTYSLELGDGPFTLLNGLALLLVCVQLYFHFWPREQKKTGRKR